MRILKYLLLILLLVAIGLFVFVATQNANYKITKSIFIKSPKTTVYNYLIDFRNWETFDSRLSDVAITYTESTLGKGSWMSWKGATSGYIQTVALKENDSIFQNNVLNGEKSQVSWKFKDTVGGTKITWKTEGKLDFNSKVTSFFNGGIDKVLISEFELTMYDLEKTLNYEMSTFSVKNIGLVNRVGTYYLKQSFNCKKQSVIRNIKIVLPRLRNFFKSNDIKATGKPFISYYGDPLKDSVVQVSVCIPVKDTIFKSNRKDIQLGKLEGYTAMKTRLIGDYSHTQQAWKSSLNYLAKNKISVNPAIQISEVYWKDMESTRYPSKWETDIYIPVLPKKAIVKKRYRNPVNETISVESLPILPLITP